MTSLLQIILVHSRPSTCFIRSSTGQNENQVKRTILVQLDYCFYGSPIKQNKKLFSTCSYFRQFIKNHEQLHVSSQSARDALILKSLLHPFWRFAASSQLCQCSPSHSLSITCHGWSTKTKVTANFVWNKLVGAHLFIPTTLFFQARGHLYSSAICTSCWSWSQTE